MSFLRFMGYIVGSGSPQLYALQARPWCVPHWFDVISHQYSRLKFRLLVLQGSFQASVLTSTLQLHYSVTSNLFVSLILREYLRAYEGKGMG